MAFSVGAADVPEEEERARRLRRLLIVGFVAALLPLLPGELRYHGDERFYTDGAMQMLRSGDYLTPVYADGRPRFLKPGLSYWLIAASYQAFGVNLAASRLPSLLAGAGVLWLAGRTVVALGGSESASFLAVAVLASNMSLLLVALRSTPDALLCFFLSMSLFGFLRLIACDDRRQSSFALAYLGAGLAVAAKGFLGLLPVLFSFAFCALGRPRGAPSARTLVHWPTMAAGTVVGLSWFVAVLLQHGAVAWAGFFADQVGGKVEASWLRATANVPRYVLAALQHFLPWTALAAVAWFARRRGGPSDSARQRVTSLYALGVFAVMVAIFAAGRDMRPRYLLPSYPLVAVALCPWLERQFNVPGNRSPARLLGLFAALIGIGGGALIAAVGWSLDRRIAAAGLTLAVASAIAVAATRGGWRQAVAGTALLVMSALPLYDLLVSPVFKSQPAPAAAARISALDPAPARVGLLGLGGEFAGLLSLHLEGRVAVTTPEEAPAAGEPAAPAVLVATEGHRHELIARGYRLEPCGFLQRRWTGRDLRQALRQGGAASYLPQTMIPVYLAIAGERRS
jgi:4-amino-4-deoxy-L-arabinose transferase-like glycosyltransferase